jgi:hypothetical protein
LCMGVQLIGFLDVLDMGQSCGVAPWDM